MRYIPRIMLCCDFSEIIVLDDDNSHYLRNVMRAKISDKVIVFWANSSEWQAQIVQLEKKVLKLTLIKKLRDAPKYDTLLDVAISSLKKDSMGWLTEKLAELGVNVIQPLKTVFVQNKINSVDKLQKIVVDASRQSELINIAKVYAEVGLHDFLETSTDKTIIYLDEKSSGAPINSVITSMKIKSRIVILGGGEGGFSDDEQKLILSYDNVIPVSLGREILRAETAVISAVAIIQAFWGTWRDSKPRDWLIK